MQKIRILEFSVQKLGVGGGGGGSFLPPPSVLAYIKKAHPE